ncbi:uncharacterized protein LOC128257261 [Drosophila gunungcola]|uniref:uncharacterized protein LOC128257261 n=1 Tax=Drosophila gunungcola TaxID=103775 RepID=UPI0022E14FB3|nr:uncharacterized protein LOC128257261 [Drosophila gunungcola]
MSSWLRSSLVELGRTNRHADCSFVIETEGGISKTFSCHKLIFSCASDVFDRMLYGDYKESSSGVVRLNDVDPDIFEKFRDYLYGYEYEKLQKYDFDTLTRLCEFGNKYLVKSLEEDCVRELQMRKDTFDMGELLRLFQCAHRLNRKSLIDQMAWELKITFKGTLDHSGVYEFSWAVFKHYIEVIAGKLSEADRFRLLEMYLKYNGIEDAENSTQVVTIADPPPGTANEDMENPSSVLPSAGSLPLQTKEDIKPNYVADLIGLIKFGEFSPKEFHDGPGKSRFLSLAQKYEHMYQIAQNGVLARKELLLKAGSRSGSRTEQTPTIQSHSRRVVALGGTLVREEHATPSLTTRFSHSFPPLWPPHEAI